MAKLLNCAAVCAVVLFAAMAQCKVYLHEAFDSDAAWTASSFKSDYGAMKLSSGDFFGDEKINQGYKTSQDAHFYATSRPLATELTTNEGKDLVVSVSVKHEQGLDCGGGYIKLFHDSPAKDFNGDTEYFMMFGPDQCGPTRKVHIIFNYKGENLLWLKQPRYPDDRLTHVYTVVVHPDNTYEFYVDQEKKESGKLEEDWKFLPPKEIDDPSDSKPADWVDEATMVDPSDTKPADWDNEPAEIVDESAKKPDDWDTEEDGEWEAPMVPNPKHKGEWHAKRIPNPAYKGPWRARQIANPKYEADSQLYMMRKPVKNVGIDVWQVRSGSIFDNIIIGDSLEEVNAIVESTWKATKDAEKKAYDEKQAASRPAASDDAHSEHDGHDHGADEADADDDEL